MAWAASGASSCSTMTTTPSTTSPRRLAQVIPGVTLADGYRFADRIHHTGLAIVWSGAREDAEQYWSALDERRPDAGAARRRLGAAGPDQASAASSCRVAARLASTRGSATPTPITTPRRTSISHPRDLTTYHVCPVTRSDRPRASRRVAMRARVRGRCRAATRRGRWRGCRPRGRAARPAGDGAGRAGSGHRRIRCALRRAPSRQTCRTCAASRPGRAAVAGSAPRSCRAAAVRAGARRSRPRSGGRRAGIPGRRTVTAAAAPGQCAPLTASVAAPARSRSLGPTATP